MTNCNIFDIGHEIKDIPEADKCVFLKDHYICGSKFIPFRRGPKIEALKAHIKIKKTHKSTQTRSVT